MKQGSYQRVFKRLFDIVLSLLVLIVLSPLLFLLWLLVRVKHGSPAVFVQERPGKNGEVFKLRKFRTMTNECDENGELLSDEKRLTKFGEALRSSSLDELPEFANILRGEMSFVGPRPLLVAYLPLYNERQAQRHNVRPGLTGLAQVSGRNLLTWEEKFELDVQYVENVSFIGDVKIVLKTVINVLRREGISSESAATMEPFHGTEPEQIAEVTERV